MKADSLRQEREQLEHQRERLEEILSERMVSPVMVQNLRQRLSDISERMLQISIMMRLPPADDTRTSSRV